MLLLLTDHGSRLTLTLLTVTRTFLRHVQTHLASVRPVAACDSDRTADRRTYRMHRLRGGRRGRGGNHQYHRGRRCRRCR